MKAIDSKAYSTLVQLAEQDSELHERLLRATEHQKDMIRAEIFGVRSTAIEGLWREAVRLIKAEPDKEVLYTSKEFLGIQNWIAAIGNTPIHSKISTGSVVEVVHDKSIVHDNLKTAMENLTITVGSRESGLVVEKKGRKLLSDEREGLHFLVHGDGASLKYQLYFSWDLFKDEAGAYREPNAENSPSYALIAGVARGEVVSVIGVNTPPVFYEELGGKYLLRRAGLDIADPSNSVPGGNFICFGYQGDRLKLEPAAVLVKSTPGTVSQIQLKEGEKIAKNPLSPQ